jgi:hypothetical protein
MVMALMMIFGTAGTWKVRTMAASREATFRALEPRHGDRDANPPGWPRSADMQVRQGGPSLMPFDPFANETVVRGPVLSDNSSGQYLLVNTNLLDMTVGIEHGHSRIQRQFPLLARMPPHGIDSQRDTVIVDATLWQYETMGIWSNVERRILSLYDFQLQTRAADECMRYAQAAALIRNNPRKPDLTPLDGDDPEIPQLLGRRHPGFYPPGEGDGGFWFRVGYRAVRIPDLTGNVPNSCTTNEGEVQQAVSCYIERLERNHMHSLARTYIGYYQQARQNLQQVMPATPAIQQQIQDLDDKIQALQQFDGSIQPSSNCTYMITNSP